MSPHWAVDVLPSLLVAGAVLVGVARHPAEQGVRRGGAAARLHARVGRRAGAAVAATAAAVAAYPLLAPAVGRGPAVVALGAAAVVGARLLAALEPAALRRAREQLVSGLPLVLDLLGACLAAGATLPAAVSAVASAVPEPWAGELDTVAGSLRLGAPVGQAASRLLVPAAPAEVRAAWRMVARAAESGTPLAALVDLAADEARAAAASAGLAAARRAGVLAVLPLGFCFLPAFVLVGVVPVVAGVVSGLR